LQRNDDNDILGIADEPIIHLLIAQHSTTLTQTQLDWIGRHNLERLTKLQQQEEQ